MKKPFLLRIRRKGPHPAGAGGRTTVQRAVLGGRSSPRVRPPMGSLKMPTVLVVGDEALSG